MRDRSDDSLLSRLVLFLWLPLAALVGLLPLEDKQDETGLGVHDAPGLTQVQTVAQYLLDLPLPDIIYPDRPVPQSGPTEIVPVAIPKLEAADASIARRAAYTHLLRRQLLRIPDASDTARG